MKLEEYLPSGQFALILVSLFCATGRAYAANRFSKPTAPPTLSAAQNSGASAADNAQWEATLSAVQANTGTAPAPNVADVQALLASASSSNITASVSRKLLVNLTNAKAQGLGDDIPTQDRLVASAAAEIQASAAPNYKPSDLVIVPQTGASMRDYGNKVITIMEKHPQANEQQTLMAVGYATDSGKDATLSALPPIGEAYSAIVKELLAAPVPQTLAPLHLQIVNDFAQIAATYPDMQKILQDPLRGLAALQKYESLLGEVSRVFTNTAQAFQKSGILFDKGEPGSAWSVFLSPY